MIFIGQQGEMPVHISLKPNHITIGLGSTIGIQVVSYDFAGRLWTAFFDDVTYRRGLDGQHMAKWRAAGGERCRAWLSAEEAEHIEARAHALTSSILVDAECSALNLSPEAKQILTRATDFNAARSAADAAQFSRIYQPIGILPPDQYLSVVLQAAEGCSFNTCTFCDFYKLRPFRIKPVEEFRAHAAAVRAFLGDGLSLRRGIFLGDANALVMPMKKLMPLLEAVHTVYDVKQIGGLYAFLDGFSGNKKSTDNYRLLAEAGLRRVYIGLESGCADLLRFLNKPGQPSDAFEAICSLKAAGVSVGVIVLLGAGGTCYDAAHVRETIALLNQMPLDQDDILYFSELVISPDRPYARQATSTGIVPLTPEAVRAQGTQIEAELHIRPRISRYNIEEFIY
jgi:hypothetical protein